jgi:hypothetical protein
VFIEAGGAPPARKMKNRAGPVVERRAGLRIGAELAPRLKKISQEIRTRVQIGAYEPHQRFPAAA